MRIDTVIKQCYARRVYAYWHSNKTVLSKASSCVLTQ